MLKVVLHTCLFYFTLVVILTKNMPALIIIMLLMLIDVVLIELKIKRISRKSRIIRTDSCT